jgi:hypothetical protein
MTFVVFHRSMQTTDTLLEYLLDGRPQALRPALQQWLSTSRRFTAFVEENRDKIRKKIRLAQDAGAIEDLKWELEVAYLLHNDKRFNVSYEAYSRAQPFGPDFRVSYTTSFAFNVEVTRVRSAIAEEDAGNRAEREARRLAETAVNKLHQIVPGMPNVVAIGMSELSADEAGFAAVMGAVRRGVEQGDLAVMTRIGFNSTPAFIKAYERLSAVIAHSQDGSAAFLWRNPSARAPLPAKAITALRNSFITSA